MSELSKQYQRKTDKQHVLDNPDTYIGSVEKVDSDMWVLEENKIVLKPIEYIPGLYKLMDEGIVNCRDHVLRMNQLQSETKKLVTYIEVEIDETTGQISFTNDGNGVDVAEHPEEKLWIPEMVFGHLRTSTNYDTTEKKIVGGKNGFGFKLVLIWSKWGKIETVDHIRGLKYVQEFRDNLSVLEPPKITKCSSSKPYTKVSFMIFRTGNCLIVGNCTKTILTFVFEFVKGLLMREYDIIKAIHDIPVSKMKKNKPRKKVVYYTPTIYSTLFS
jgi:DNA topoisomerase-2